MDFLLTGNVVEGLDALMLALKTWNGGIIIISHDERFITTVADEVRYCLTWIIFTLIPCDSCGSVETARSASLEVMSRCTRCVLWVSTDVYRCRFYYP